MQGEGASGPACAPLLELLVSIHLARDDLDAAREALDRLTALATGCGDDRTAAAAEPAAGRVRAAEGDERASSHLQAALEAFSALDLPLEAAQAQLDLAKALVPAAPAGAVAEARLAGDDEEAETAVATSLKVRGGDELDYEHADSHSSMAFGKHEGQVPTPA